MPIAKVVVTRVVIHLDHNPISMVLKKSQPFSEILLLEVKVKQSAQCTLSFQKHKETVQNLRSNYMGLNCQKNVTNHLPALLVINF